jgi:cyclase
MRRISKSAYADVLLWGCNPGFIATDDGVLLIDTPQQPIDAVRWRETITDQFGPIRHLVNTEPHPDHIRGNAYFPGVEVIGHAGMVARYEAAIPMMTAPELGEQLKQIDQDSVWLFNHPDYPPNPPTRTFADSLTLRLGRHTIEILHTPGHTPPQTAILLADEGMVFTGDNVFHKCKTYVQECDPWELLATLDRIGQLDVETIVPGHGEPCGTAYLAEQARVVQEWVAVVERLVDRGLTEEEALAEPIDVPRFDPYPLGQRRWLPSYDVDAQVADVNRRNIRNLYQRITARRSVSR